ncbi:MAG: electron transport complex subunit RsxC [Clostridia bacterium]|nr:electron transport complex subunit RsxC [Clostridia bacterium]
MRLPIRKSPPVPAKTMPPVPLYTVPLQQHIGAACLPRVALGERILRGQLLGEPPEGKLGARVHSPVSGRIMGFEQRTLLSGSIGPCVIIENDGLNEAAPADWPVGTPSQLSPDEIRLAARQAGLAGMGGAGFPSHIKLAPPQKVDTLIVNAAECEPYLTCDACLLAEHTAKVITGIRAAQKALGAERVIIGIEGEPPQGLANSGIAIKSLPHSYPQGGEKQLIHTLTKRKVPLGKLPAEVGVTVFNVATLAALADALEGRPCTERLLTVAGGAVNTAYNIWVKTGTPIGAVFDYCGGFSGESGKIIAGGPMMGVAQPNLSAPVVKTTSGLLAFTQQEALLPEETNCIRCGFCVEGCPMRINPIAIYNARTDPPQAKKHNARACIECGCCAYICPAKIPLVQGIRLAKELPQRGCAQ